MAQQTPDQTIKVPENQAEAEAFVNKYFPALYREQKGWDKTVESSKDPILVRIYDNITDVAGNTLSDDKIKHYFLNEINLNKEIAKERQLRELYEKHRAKLDEHGPNIARLLTSKNLDDETEKKCRESFDVLLRSYAYNSKLMYLRVAEFIPKGTFVSLQRFNEIEAEQRKSHAEAEQRKSHAEAEKKEQASKRLIQSHNVSNDETEQFNIKDEITRSAELTKKRIESFRTENEGNGNVFFIEKNNNDLISIRRNGGKVGFTCSSKDLYDFYAGNNNFKKQIFNEQNPGIKSYTSADQNFQFSEIFFQDLKKELKKDEYKEYFKEHKLLEKSLDSKLDIKLDGEKLRFSIVETEFEAENKEGKLIIKSGNLEIKLEEEEMNKFKDIAQSKLKSKLPELDYESLKQAYSLEKSLQETGKSPTTDLKKEILSQAFKLLDKDEVTRIKTNPNEGFEKELSTTIKLEENNFKYKFATAEFTYDSFSNLTYESLKKLEDKANSYIPSFWYKDLELETDNGLKFKVTSSEASKYNDMIKREEFKVIKALKDQSLEIVKMDDDSLKFTSQGKEFNLSITEDNSLIVNGKQKISEKNSDVIAPLFSKALAINELSSINEAKLEMNNNVIKLTEEIYVTKGNLNNFNEGSEQLKIYSAEESNNGSIKYSEVTRIAKSDLTDSAVKKISQVTSQINPQQNQQSHNDRDQGTSASRISVEDRTKAIGALNTLKESSFKSNSGGEVQSNAQKLDNRQNQGKGERG